MNRAAQQQLSEQTNQSLIKIRQAEIDYYINLHSAFGVQAAVLGGFIFLVMFENGRVDADPNSQHIVRSNMYSAFASVAIALSLHIIITTTLLKMLGPGLALNGPIGSMLKASEGLKAELIPLAWSFFIFMVFFVMTTILSFWITMDTIAAIICTLVFLFASYFWISYSLRITRKFHWNEKSSPWKEDERFQTRSKVDDDPVALLGINLVQMDHEREVAFNANEAVMEGYLGTHSFYANMTSKVGETIEPPKWERLYVTLDYGGSLFFYANRKKYLANADQNRVNTRPLRIDNFTIRTDKPLVIELVPKEDDSFKHWALRCDTEEELQLWTKSLLDESSKDN